METNNPSLFQIVLLFWSLLFWDVLHALSSSKYSTNAPSRH